MPGKCGGVIPCSISGFRNNYIEAVPLNQNALFCSLFLIHVLFRQMDFPACLEKEINTGKERAMSNNNENRVLCRNGARQLTQNEVEQVTGAKLTLASELLTGPISNPDDILDQ